MDVPMTLPGLNRLIQVSRSHELPSSLSPPRLSSPRAGELFFGLPFDPQLAVVYQHLSAAELGEFSLLDPGDAENGLDARNRRLKKYAMEPFLSSIVFGGVLGLAYCYATVPGLADEHGLQPVIEINHHAAELAAYPLASSVDRFFDLYARYLEQTTEANTAALRLPPPWDIPAYNFPWSVPELVAQDAPLMALVRAGRFDFLTQDDRSSREWLQQLQDAQAP